MMKTLEGAVYGACAILGMTCYRRQSSAMSHGYELGEGTGPRDSALVGEWQAGHVGPVRGPRETFQMSDVSSTSHTVQMSVWHEGNAVEFDAFKG
jgi:hypothetical protein